MSNKQFYYLFLIISPFLSLFACEKGDEAFMNVSAINPTDTIKIISIEMDTLHVKDSARIEYEKLFTIKSITSSPTQGFAIYNDLLFNCHHSNDIIDVYNINDGKGMASICLEPDDIIHCNNVNFGPDFYSINDRFPLLYVQQRGNTNKLIAYRITVNNDTIYSAQKIQTISFIPCSSSITAIDVYKNVIYVIYSIYNKWYISPMDVPQVFNGDIIVNLSQASETYYLPFKKVIQDTASNKDYLYYVCGKAYQGELWRIDINSKEAIVIDLPQQGLYGEPEGIEYYNDQLYVSFFNSAIYKISIID